jgi:hypothetical protein
MRHALKSAGVLAAGWMTGSSSWKTPIYLKEVAVNRERTEQELHLETLKQEGWRIYVEPETSWQDDLVLKDYWSSYSAMRGMEHGRHEFAY